MTADAKVATGQATRAKVQAHTTASAQRHLYRLFLLVGDATILLIAFTLAYWLRFSVGIAVSTDIVPNPQDYLVLAVVLIPVWLSIFAIFGLYDFNILLGDITEYGRVFNAVTWGMMAVMIYGFFNPEFVIARAWLVFSWVLSGLFVSAYRLLMRRIAYRARRFGFFVAPTVIVGTNKEAIALADQLRDSAGSGLQIVGFVSVDGKDAHLLGDQVHGIKVLGTIEHLSEILDEHKIEEVVIATTAMESEQLVQVSQRLTTQHEDVRMRLSSGLYEVFTTGMEVTTRNSVPLTSLRRLRLSRVETLLKLMLDYTLILLALPV